MAGFGLSVERLLAGQPGFARALRHAITHGLVDLDLWSLFTNDEQIINCSVAVNGRYPARNVLCFAERVDADDVACVVLGPDGDHDAGQILIVHDFASPGFEVGMVFSSFWQWFRAAVDDMIDAFDASDV